MRADDIAGMKEALQIQLTELKSARETFKGKRQTYDDALVEFGKLYPVQRRNIADILEKASKGQELSRFELDALEMHGGQEGRQLAKNQYRQWAKGDIGILPPVQQDLIARRERTEMQDASGHEAFEAGQKQQLVKEIGTAAAQVTIDNQHHVDIVVRPDEKFITDTYDEVRDTLRSIQADTNAQLENLKRLLHDAQSRTNKQGRNSAREF